jgi:hypothetical protein
LLSRPAPDPKARYICQARCLVVPSHPRSTTPSLPSPRPYTTPALASLPLSHMLLGCHARNHPLLLRCCAPAKLPRRPCVAPAPTPPPYCRPLAAPLSRSHSSLAVSASLQHLRPLSHSSLTASVSCPRSSLTVPAPCFGAPSTCRPRTRSRAIVPLQHPHALFLSSLPHLSGAALEELPHHPLPCSGAPLPSCHAVLTRALELSRRIRPAAALLRR